VFELPYVSQDKVRTKRCCRWSSAVSAQKSWPTYVYLYCWTGRRERVVSCTDFYSRGLGFKSGPGDRICWHVFRGFLFVANGSVHCGHPIGGDFLPVPLLQTTGTHFARTWFKPLVDHSSHATLSRQKGLHLNHTHSMPPFDLELQNDQASAALANETTKVWKWLSSGLLRRVVWYKFTDVWEMLAAASIIRGNLATKVFQYCGHFCPPYVHIYEVVRGG
jgi:hypothetical protein